MRVLLDECVPQRFKSELPGLNAATVFEMGWSGKTNGALLLLAQEKFDAFITVDQNLQYQQNLKKFKIGIISLQIPNNRYESFLPLASRIKNAAARIQPGQIIKLNIHSKI